MNITERHQYILQELQRKGSVIIQELSEAMQVSGVTIRKDLKMLEDKIRDWALADSAIIIICGPIVSKSSKTIGKEKVTVPDSFFKVILSPYQHPAKAIGFLFLNGQATKSIDTYAVTVDSIEKRTKMDFFSTLPKEVEIDVESHSNYYAWPN